MLLRVVIARTARLPQHESPDANHSTWADSHAPHTADDFSLAMVDAIVAGQAARGRSLSSAKICAPGRAMCIRDCLTQGRQQSNQHSCIMPLRQRTLDEHVHPLADREPVSSDGVVSVPLQSCPVKAVLKLLVVGQEPSSVSNVFVMAATSQTAASASSGPCAGLVHKFVCCPCQPAPLLRLLHSNLH